MSRIGKKVIIVPEKTEATFASGVFSVKGPQGQLSKNFKSDIDVTISDKEIILKPKASTSRPKTSGVGEPTEGAGFEIPFETKALWGSYGSVITNMITGVNTPFAKKLILEGIGYKSEVKGDKLILALGFSHPVVVEIPKSLKISAEKNVIIISGIDKEEVGRFTANLRAMKKPEPYKGKGFRYDGEVIKRKQGKKTV